MAIYSVDLRICKEQFISICLTFTKLKHDLVKGSPKSYLLMVDSRVNKLLICRKYDTKTQCKFLHKENLIKGFHSEEKRS